MPETQEETSIRTKLPTELDEEQPFLSIAEVKLSLRQMLTLVIGFASWMTAAAVTGSILSISPVFAGLIWSWIVIVAIFFTFAKKDGLTYEEYLAQRLVFLISDRKFVLKDDKDDAPPINVDEADWQAIEDPYNPWQGDNK